MRAIRSLAQDYAELSLAGSEEASKFEEQQQQTREVVSVERLVRLEASAAFGSPTLLQMSEEQRAVYGLQIWPVKDVSSEVAEGEEDEQL